MSLHTCLVCIEGSHLEDAPEWMGAFEYSLTVAPLASSDWDGLEHWLADPEHKAIGEHAGWTVVLDPETVMATDPDACTNASRVLNTRVFAMVCEGVSGTYGFTVCRNGYLQRHLMVVGGGIAEQAGNPLPDEDGRAAGSLTESDVTALMQRLVFPYEELSCIADFRVYRPEWTGIARRTLPDPPPPAPEAPPVAPKRPWWKVW